MAAPRVDEPRLHPLRELTLTRWREFVREPGALFWTFGFPLLLTLALGVAFRTDAAPRTRVVVVGPTAAAVADGLSAVPGVAAEVASDVEARRRLQAGVVALMVTVTRPGGPVVYRFDPSRPEGQAMRGVVDDALQRAAGRVDPREVKDDAVKSPGSRYVDWLVPGLLGMQLMSGSLWGIAFSIVQSRQRKLLKRLMATPMRRRDFLLSFILSRLGFLALEVPVLLLFSRWVFDVETHGSLLAVGFLSVLGAAAFAGIALLCAARAQNTETANGLVNLVTMPMFVVSGVFFASSRFPELVQPLIRALPLTALNEALRAVMNEGAPLASQGVPMAILAVWTVGSFAVAMRLFRWT
jgi:ABC transporter DrrB family efflux protein